MVEVRLQGVAWLRFSEGKLRGSYGVDVRTHMLYGKDGETKTMGEELDRLGRERRKGEVK